MLPGLARRRDAGEPEPRAGGPENSLTYWQDQGAGEILCDYGAAYSFVEFLASRYGVPFVSALHREDAPGFAGLQNVLNQFGADRTSLQIVHEWAAMSALDGILDAGAKLKGSARDADYQTSTLHSTINWDSPHAYSTPGAPPNGSDFVRLRNGAGQYLSAKQLDSISFDGAATLEPTPVEWTTDTPADAPSGSALYSGTGDNFDRGIAIQVAVPAASPTLTLDTKWDTETGFDSGFVQVSTDGGATWTSLGNADTTNELDPGANQNLVDNLPGFNGQKPGKQAFVATVPLGPGFHAVLTGGELRRIVGDKADVVAAIVTYDEPTEQVSKYARYQLRVNGALQPGG